MHARAAVVVAILAMGCRSRSSPTLDASSGDTRPAVDASTGAPVDAVHAEGTASASSGIMGGGAGDDDAGNGGRAAASRTDGDHDASPHSDAGGAAVTAHARDSGARDGSAAASAASDAGIAAHDDGASSTVHVDESQNQKTVTLTKGQTLVVTLSAIPSSGYDWFVVRAPAALGTPTMGFVESTNPAVSGGKRRLAWTSTTALPPGDHAIDLAYRRGFEGNAPPQKTFRLKVRSAR